MVPETLELVGLEGKGERMPDELSGGEQQRVAIARAFVNRPMILIADEPTGNLDPTTSVGIMKLLDRINRTGTTVLMATHDAGVVDQMRKRVIELDHGRVIRDEAAGRLRVPALTTVPSTERVKQSLFRMQLRYVFSELGQGLRRNVSMHIAVVLTLFVSMTLMGLGVLMKQQADMADALLGQTSCRSPSTCAATATTTRPAPARSPTSRRPRSSRRSTDNPETADVRYESQGGGLREGQGAVRRGPVRRPEPGDDRGRHAAVVLDHARRPEEVRGRDERRRRPRRGLADP